MLAGTNFHFMKFQELSEIFPNSFQRPLIFKVPSKNILMKLAGIVEVA